MLQPRIRCLVLVAALTVASTGCTAAASEPITADAEPLAGTIELREATEVPAALQPGAVADSTIKDPVRPVLFVDGQKWELRQQN